MRVISTTNARQKLAEIVNIVRFKNEIIGLGRHNKIEAVILKYPEFLNSKVNEITNINANSSSFDFLADEPDLYSMDDLEEVYV